MEKNPAMIFVITLTNCDEMLQLSVAIFEKIDVKTVIT